MTLHLAYVISVGGYTPEPYSLAKGHITWNQFQVINYTYKAVSQLFHT
jgi:hypothetical protein